MKRRIQVNSGYLHALGRASCSTRQRSSLSPLSLLDNFEWAARLRPALRPDLT